MAEKSPMLITLDVSEIMKAHEELAGQIVEKVNNAVESLSIMAHAHIVELAQEKLHSRREIFLSNLKGPDKVDEFTWAITLGEKAAWIDEGLQQFDMIPGFLASPHTKTGKNGKYLVVPFVHNKKPTAQTGFQKALTNEIKKEMAKRKIPYGKVERNPDGSTKLGLLHSFNISGPDVGKNRTMPGRAAPWHIGGPIKPKDEGMGPFLHGVRVYQKQVMSKQGKIGIQRDIVTFRTVSESQKGQKWQHPGLEGVGVFDKTKEWAEKEWEQTILPNILSSLGIE